jgi:tetratricopeptide (TPR) repeat protein
MSDQAIYEAVHLYKGARLLRQRASKPIELTASALDFRARCNMEAFTLLEKIVTLGKKSEEVRTHRVFALAHRHLGLLRGSYYSPDLAKQKMYHEEVIDHLITALDSGLKKDAKICRALGVAYFYLGNHAAAVQLLEEALTFNDKDVRARYLLSYSYVALHDRVGARQQCEELRKTAPHLADQLEHKFSELRKHCAETEQELLRFIQGFKVRRHC